MSHQLDKSRLALNSTMPGTEGIWTFVFIDMLVFLAIFFLFMSERMRLPAVYLASQRQLNEMIGFTNTLILLTSSWSMVEAVHASRRGDAQKVKNFLALTLGLGAVFGANKAFEYYQKFQHGITPASNSFFSLYFFITIVHFLHVIGGMIFIWHCRKDAILCTHDRRYVTQIENVGHFWHYVDVLWIFIFPLLYLVGLK